MASPVKSLLLVDLSNAWHMAWHSSADLELSAAFDKTVNRVRGLSEGFDLVAVCCDSPPYRRKKLSADYKSQRDAHPASMLEQFARVKERLRKDGFLLWECPGYECDDIIATAVGYAKREELAVTIASSDKDLLSLVDDAARVRAMSLATGQIFDQFAVREKFGVDPHMVPELLALMGDKSDNIPGIQGVGVKNAAKLLREFGNALNVFECAATIKGALGESVRAHGREKVELALRLIRLETDAPIDWDAVFAERKPLPLTKEEDMSAADDDFENDLAGSEEVAERDNGEPTSSPRHTPIPPPLAKSDALAVSAQSNDWSLALEPTSTEKAWTLAGHLFNSRMFPQYKNQAAVFCAILRGRALGIDATTALSLFHDIEGRLAMHADLVVGLVLRSRKAEFFELTELTHSSVTYATKRKGARKEVTVTWTLDDAVRAGLMTKDNGRYRGISRTGKPSNWDKYPRAMLRHRAATELARAVYPDVTAGLYTPDELSDGAVIEAELVG